MSWTAPATGSPIDGYNIYQGTSSGGESTIAINGTTLVPGTSTTVTVLGAGPYYFYVTAVNASGASLASNEAVVALNAVPGAPTGLTGTVVDPTDVAFSWTAPTSQGSAAVTSYTVTSSPDGLFCTSVSPTPPATTCTVNGLSTGTAYTFTATATSPLPGGTSVPSNQVSATPAATVPSVPTSFTAVAANASVALSWDASSNGGGGSVGYNIYQGTTPGGESGTPINGVIPVSATTFTVPGLTNGTTYYFTVKAVNAIGSSAASTEKSATPAPLAVPGAPTNVTATGLFQSASVSWTAPVSSGGSAIIDYTVTSSPGGFFCTATAPVTTCSAGGLTNGVPYTFTVTANNSQGPSAASAASNSVVPATSAPGAPTGLVVTNTGAATGTLDWTAPGYTGGDNVIDYNVYMSSTPGGTRIFLGNTGSTTPSYALTGLTPGTPYYFVVVARNNFGLSPASNEAKTIAGVNTAPGAPTIGTATGLNGSARLTFTVPANNGDPITGFTVTKYIAGVYSGIQTSFAPAPDTTPGATNSVTVTGLTNGTAYTFTVFATNGTDGAASAASNAATPSTIPGAPASAAVASGNGSAALTWTVPVSDGFSPITGYNVYNGATRVNGATPITGLTYTVSGLTNGTIYTFTVKAVNANGESSGAASTTPATVTPGPVAPGAPTGLTATPADSSAMLSWTAPASNGGSTIVGYEVWRFDTPACFGSSTKVTGTQLVSGTTTTVTGLTNGTQYCFYVKAANIISGTITPGASSIGATVTPAGVTVPSAPTSISASAGVSSAIVAWGIPTSNGNSPITGYVVTPYIGAVAQTPVTYNTASAIQIVPGLTPGTSYTFTVAAINAIGTGANSGFSNFVTPTAPPAPSTLLPGATLAQGSSLVSPNGLFTATVQSDGNFVVYGPTGAIWWTGTNNSSDQNALVLQSDSNLVLSGPAGDPLWWTSTNNRGATGLHMQNDGNLVLYGTGGALWSSMTGLL